MYSEVLNLDLHIPETRPVQNPHKMKAIYRVLFFASLMIVGTKESQSIKRPYRANHPSQRRLISPASGLRFHRVKVIDGSMVPAVVEIVKKIVNDAYNNRWEPESIVAYIRRELIRIYPMGNWMVALDPRAIDMGEPNVWVHFEVRQYLLLKDDIFISYVQRN
ncbi:hypothetical protein Trydic_g3659 [Trypoxylus dichotomus]